MQFLKRTLWREWLFAARFGLVGIAATAFHLAVAWILLKSTEVAPILVNTTAFLLAFGVSFVGNYVWTFRSPGNAGRAISRFFAIAVCAFAANTVILAFLLQKGWLSPVASVLVSAAVVPIMSYTASRRWGFR